MADHPSALKRHRQSLKRRARNQATKTRLRHLVRDVRTAIASKDGATAAAQLKSASKEIDKAVSKGVLHRNSAARKISRLAHAVHQLSARS